MLSILSRLVFFLSFSALFLSAQSLTDVSGNGQVLFENFQSKPLTVQAKDASGAPIAGATVTFSTPGDSRVQILSANTDSNGLASSMVVTNRLQQFQSFSSQTLHASSPQGSVDFQFTTISSTGPTGPAQPGTFLLAPTSDPPTLTGASGSTLPGAIQIGFVAGAGVQLGQPLPNVGIQTIPFDTFPLPGTCSGAGGVALSNAKGVATCDLVITAAPGTYEFSINIGDLLGYRVFTLIVTPSQSCTYSLSASSQTQPASATSGSVNVLTASGCFWTAASNATWITISSGATGRGTGAVAFSVAANTTGASRSGTLSIAGQTFSVTQSASATTGLSITTGASLPAATQNSPYAATLAAAGGTSAYKWSSTGTLPPGLSLAATGTISGIPSASGVYGFTATVTDSTGAAASATLSLTVNSIGAQTFSFLNASFPDGVSGQSYSQEVKTAGGCVSPFHPNAAISAAGALPPGMSLQYSGSQTFIAGTPSRTGSYSFTLSATDACAVAITHAFTITIGTSAPPPAQFSANPASLTFTYAAGGAQPANQSFALSSNTSGAAFTASATSAGNWLTLVSGATGSTPATITAGVVNYTALAAGSYTGAVSITPVNGGTPLQVPVTLIISASSVVTTPTALTFSLTTAGIKSSGQQSITVTAMGAGSHFTTAASTVTGTGWLSVTPTAGDTPASLTVTANASNLVAGLYTGSVTIVPSSGPLVSIPVTLTVTGGPMLAVNPPALTFDVQTGLTPTPQTLSLTSGPPIPFNVSISPTAASSWLAVTGFANLTPATLNVAINPVGLAPGMYTATIKIEDPSNSSPPVSIPVSVNVVASPIVAAVTNAASFQAGPIAPGELLVLFGSNLGPATLVSTGFPLGIVLSGASVLFDGSPGTMLYSSAQQVAVIAPVGLAGRASTQVQVQYQDRLSLPVNVRVVDSSPGIFMADSSGQGAIVNQNGSPNSVNSPAPAGSVILIFGTGGGQTNPPRVDGAASSGVAPLVLPVSVQIDGIPAEVQYKGAAPGLTGLDQINIKLPLGVRTGVPVPALVTIGTITAAPVTLYVQAP